MLSSGFLISALVAFAASVIAGILSVSAKEIAHKTNIHLRTKKKNTVKIFLNMRSFSQLLCLLIPATILLMVPVSSKAFYSLGQSSVREETIKHLHLSDYTTESSISDKEYFALLGDYYLRIALLYSEHLDNEEEIQALKDQMTELKTLYESLYSSLYPSSEIHWVTVNNKNYAGSVTPGILCASEGETVSLKLTPFDRYYIECTDSFGNIIPSYTSDGGVWNFEMPDNDVTVYIKQE